MRLAPIGLTLVLVATAAGQDAARHVFEARVRDALTNARPALLHHLEYCHGGPLALITLAALHDEVPRDDPMLQEALEKLSKLRLDGTYELALRLMILSEAPWFPDAAKRGKKDLDGLLRNFKAGRNSAGFTYPHSRNDRNWDLSNTQYGALGLRAAVALGLDVPRKSWEMMAESLVAHQARDGGFGYGPTTGNIGYASMTVAGIAVLQLCKQNLGAPERQRARGWEKLEAQMDRALERGWEWMRGNRHEIGDVATRSCYYFHYGLERAAILSDVEDVGGVDWYRAGAEMLIAEQLSGGGWTSNGLGSALGAGLGGAAGAEGFGSPVDTAFAVLFLRRKFQRQLGPVTGERQKGILDLDEQAPSEAVKAAAKLAVARGSAGMRDVLQAMESGVRNQRIAAAYALHGLCGEDFGFNPHRGPEHNAAPIAAAKAWLVAHPHR